MKALIVGGGAREHAIAWKLRRDDPTIDMLCVPGNPGIAALAHCVPLPGSDHRRLVELVEEEGVDVTIVGPEAPLAAGIVDRFRDRGLPIFGPTRDAAAIETSKRFAKDLMRRASIPTAAAFAHTDAEHARRSVRELGAPVVIKASGLAAGKGVIVCATIEEADRAIDLMLREGAFGQAGAEILVEEFMEGEEISVFGLTDGAVVLPMLPLQDHKRLLDGDKGPNTGGMGAYAPVSVATSGVVRAVADILEVAVEALADEGRPFTGLLYAGIMLTASGPRVVEFNCRFGDPETEALLPLMRSSLLDPVLAIARGEGLAGFPALSWRQGEHAVTTVVASHGYPDAPRTGDAIALPDPAPGVEIFHAGTAIDASGRLVTAGGRVAAVTAVAKSFEAARAASAAQAGAIEFTGRQLRTDIGWREARRGAGASRD